MCRQRPEIKFKKKTKTFSFGGSAVRNRALQVYMLGTVSKQYMHQIRYIVIGQKHHTYIHIIHSFKCDDTSWFRLNGSGLEKKAEN